MLKGGFTQDLLPIAGQYFMKVMGWDDPKRWAAFTGDEQKGPRETQVETLSKLTPVTGMLYTVGKEGVVDPLVALGKYAFGGNGRDLGKEMGESARELTRFFGSSVGLNLWYTQLAFSRAVLDNLEAFFAPRDFERKQRARQRVLRQSGQSFIFGP